MVFVLIWFSVIAGAQTTIVVSPKGPVRDLLAARNLARPAKKPVTVVVKAGDYFIDRSIEFGVEDSGVTYRAEGRVRLIGGKRLSRASTTKSSPVVTYDLRREGITSVGSLSARGFSREHQAAHSELFCNGRRMTLARYPNEGFLKIAEPADADPQDDGHGRKIGRLERGFRYGGDEPSRWTGSSDIWVHGYWSWDWADSYERVASLDPATRTIVTAMPHGLYGFRKDQRFYFLNVREELDAPGEYYVDAQNLKLYFYPPTDAKNAEVFLSTLEQPVISLREARDITIDGFTIGYTRGHGIRIEGGERVTVRNTTLLNIGNSGVLVQGGMKHVVERSEVAFTGDSAVEMTGGDRRTLTVAGHTVRDCDIHDMGQWVRTYNPAIKISGVGHKLEHNSIHNGPHAGILITGNDHIIEYNDIHHLALETGDVGAIYIGRDYTERGTVIRYNYIHELGGVGLGSMAVYLDDCASGIRVEGNVFYKLKYGAFIGGGRDNSVRKNLFVDCDPAVHVDARGLDQRPVWQNMVYEFMKPRVAEMQVTKDPYRTRYPEILTVLPYLESRGGVPPEGNVIRDNVIAGPGIAIREPAKPFVKDIGGNQEVRNAPILELMKRFAAVPLEQIGIRR